MAEGGNVVAIVIPALDPDGSLPAYVKALRERMPFPILLVDDGSAPAFKAVFAECVASAPDVFLLTHEANKGKGRALKTAFADLLARYPGLLGCVTCDSDGQHLPDDVVRCAEALRENPRALVLGCRSFGLEHVPLRSRFGNNAIRALFRLATGRRFLDTQTGLRAIPAAFMERLLDCPGERFEFESHMLLRLNGFDLVQLPIETVYINENRGSHFKPLRDSVRISAIVLGEVLVRFARFVASSLLSFGVDCGLFGLLFYRVFQEGAPFRVSLSAGLARAVSMTVNYFCNRYFVFSGGAGRRSFNRYIALAGAILAASILLTKAALVYIPWAGRHAVAAKAIIDLGLFFASFGYQRLVVFGRGAK